MIEIQRAIIFIQIYGEEVEYADDVFGGGPPGPPPMGVIRRSSKKMKSTSGDSSSTSPERNRRDDVAIDVEVERGGSGAGLSCGSTGALGGNYEDNTNFQQSANTVSNIQQMHQINMKEQRRESVSCDASDPEIVAASPFFVPSY